jgi:hypothetical protein
MESHKPSQRGDSGMGLRPERRGPRLHRTGCRHCSRWQDCGALRLSQSQIWHSGSRHPCGLPSRLNEVPNFRRGALLPRQFRQEGPLGGLITIPRRQDIVFKPRGITVIGSSPGITGRPHHVWFAANAVIRFAFHGWGYHECNTGAARRRRLRVYYRVMVRRVEWFEQAIARAQRVTVRIHTRIRLRDE